MDEIEQKMTGVSIETSDYDESDEFSDEDYYATVEVDDIQDLKTISSSQSISQNPNQQKVENKSYQPNSSLYQKYMNKISVDKYQYPKLPDFTDKLLAEEAKRKDLMRTKVKDKEDRATVEQVLDPRIRMILFKMLNKGIISEIQGCISTGKEANVYYATSVSGAERAVKIYKTSILTFKDREKYVTGDYRFRRGYTKGNPRKMVQTWAEKEMRNLYRIYSAGLPCPEPVILKSHVLVMSFIGKDGWPAPLLKEVHLSEDKARELYLNCIIMMRSLFHKCKLIHADLSEYNLLYYEGKIYLIDVSQSVELEHPHAIEFLRKDCSNITDFFRKYNVPVMTVKELFDFITDLNITDDNIDDYLAKAQEIAANRKWEMTEEEKIDEEVFKQAYIPKRLNEVIDVENDIFSEDREILYHSVTGLKPSLTTARTASDESEENDGDNSDTETADSDNSHKQNDVKSSKVHPGRSRDESPNSKKERKKQVKEARKEKLQTKIPKHVKKRKEKLGRANKKTK